VLIPPMKIDDAVLAANMSKRDLRYLLRNAVPCA
jgi:hypothetical protein